MKTVIVPPWMRAYRLEWLRADVVGGLTTASVVIPKAMASAVIAGVAVEYGLYAALAAMLIYPLLGSSRVLSVTPTAPIATLMAAQVAVVSAQTPGTSPAIVAAMLALLVGGILLAARALRLGFLANFISKPVLVGFEAGIGVVLIAGQLKAVLGVNITSATTLGTLLELPGLLDEVHLPTMLVAIAGVVVLTVLPRFVPKVPAALVWVALSIGAFVALGLGALGVQSIGAVPSGLPAIALPDLSLVAVLWPGALGIALLSFTESVAAGRAYCARDDPPVDANRELLAVGAANLASAMVGGLPAGGSTSQTAIANAAGVRSQMAQWVDAAAVLLVLVLLSSLIGLLPKAALGALILVAGAGMIKPETFRAIARIRRDEFAWALATLAGVVCIGTLEGILIAVVISMLTLIYQANHPPVYAVAYNADKRIFRRLGENARDETFQGLLMLRTEGRLTFANAANVAEKMRALVAQHEPRVIVLECSAIPDIEYTALTMLTEGEQNLRARGVTLWLAALNPDLLRLLERTPLYAALGPGRMFFNLHHALEAWQRMSAGAPAASAAPKHLPAAAGVPAVGAAPPIEHHF